MAILLNARRASKIPTDASPVHTDLEDHSLPAQKLPVRVKDLTRFNHTTTVLVLLALLAWATLKIIVHQKYGGFHFGWIDIACMVVVPLVVVSQLSTRLHRQCLMGEMIPARVFMTINGETVELTSSSGRHHSTLR